MKSAVFVWAGGISVAILLAGCSAASEPTHLETVTVDGTTFSGPHAHELAQRFETSSSAAVKKVLQDGTITDTEFTEVTAIYRACLASDGVTLIGQRDDGSTDFTFPRDMSAAQADRAVDLCGRQSGMDPVGGLYRTMERSSQNTH
jgi:hypothetical protein